MGLKKSRKIILMLMVFVLGISLSAAALTGREIMEKADERETGDTQHALMGMDLIDKKGEVSPRTIEVWAKEYGNPADDLNKMVMVFHEPASVKNTRFLQIENKDRDDDQWIYLPALQRVRRISSSQGGDSFMGSDFTYDDMESRKIDDFTYKLLKEEKLTKYECYVVEAIPKNPEEEQYQKTISWISKEHYIPLKVEMYDKDSGKLIKLMTVEEKIEKINGIWTVFSTTMEDLESGHKTQLYIKQNKGNYLLEYNKEISDRRFTQQFLKNGK
ncbi:outer membrane lipoprotein-sorting protein [Halocella sp. SP3-1]|uniref:outer membrane lipoprotein-sorting protein n=1 Tax=Halocella sp. SP3-1 TaxID=2382161 RepID=UPI00197ABF22|nr:outer membrane lipoprotein-sorting protein [Halocella sp. SP3-1]